MNEEWKQVTGFPNYEISNTGKIDKIGITKRIPVKVNSRGNYVYASLSYAPYKSRQVNVKWILNQCFSDHIYSDESVDNLEGEVWKDVVGWEDSYEVSNLGRIRTKNRLRKGKNDSDAQVSVHIKESYIDADGYERISLYQDSKTKLAGVHRLVAEAFIPNPDNLPQVNHIDGDKSNNNSNNLQWVTNEQNIRHSIEKGSRDSQKHQKRVERVSDHKQFESIFKLSDEIDFDYKTLLQYFRKSSQVTIGKEMYKLVD